jgi:hypothetical protein
LKFLGIGSETSTSRFTSHLKTIEAEITYPWPAYVPPICMPPGIPALCSGQWDTTRMKLPMS